MREQMPHTHTVEITRHTTRIARVVYSGVSTWGDVFFYFHNGAVCHFAFVPFDEVEPYTHDDAPSVSQLLTELQDGGYVALTITEPNYNGRDTQ